MQNSDTPFRVGLWAVPGFAMMSYASAVEPLRAANLLAEQELYRVSHFTDEGVSQSSGAGLVTGTHAIGDVPDLDLFLVIAGGDPFAFDIAPAQDWLCGLAGNVDVIGGVSGGAVILARAGLMSGRRLTVHWEHAARLAEEYPDLTIKRRLFFMEADRVTCGGGTAPMDLMHALIALHHGRPFARRVSDWFLHTEVRAAADPQRGPFAATLAAAPPAVAAAVEIMEDHLADPLALPQLGMMTGTSPRHLNRLFQTTLGKSTMDYYRQVRLHFARQLVRTSALPFRDVAEATGFSSAAHFSNLYAKAFGIRPQIERQARLDGLPEQT
ncbi:MAG: GlxA family transcriptional regulator [Pseudomonadota bacterium]